MTIKDIEKLSGMDRANIRFYEDEGLISPERMPNGYRNYTEDDLEILLRVKLLRCIHIPISEIRALKNGSKNLIDTLSKRIVELGREKEELSYAQDLCHIMIEDRITFENLDAEKYLDSIESIKSERENSYFALEGDRLPYVYYPWRRFLARILDLSFYNLLWSGFLIFAFNVNLSLRSNIGSLMDTFASIALMLFLEPLWVHFFGTTPGKAIFGLKIEDPEGKRLSYNVALERTWGVISNGMGYNIPIYSLVRLWKSYKLCSENEIQPWDESVSYTIKDTKTYRGVLWIGGHAIIFFLLFMAISSQQIPPHRGDITLSEFVANYNYYAEFYNIDFGNKYLGKNGTWEEKPFDGAVYIETTYEGMPEFHYTIENGYVTGLSLILELENNQDWLSSYNGQRLLSSLAMAGAQDEMGLLSRAPERISKQINNNLFKDFSFIEAGIELTYNIQYSGYLATDTNFSLLIPDEDVSENYYRMEFSIWKIK